MTSKLDCVFAGRYLGFKENEDSANRGCVIRPRQIKKNSMAVIDLTKENFIARVGDFESDPSGWKYIGNLPCIVDFSAPWCGYCKRLDPILDELAREYEGRLDLYKVDVDREEALETAFRIRTIPTLLFCPLDGPREQILGTMGKKELKQLIEEKLLK